MGVACQGAFAETRYVSANSTNPVPPYSDWSTAARTIQAAIDRCAPGDTVLVTNGLYRDGGAAVPRLIGPYPHWDLTNRVALTNAVSVRSINGPEVTIIQGVGPAGGSAVRCAFIGAGSLLAGFTLTNGACRAAALGAPELSGGGAWCEGGGVVSNCWVVGNTGLNGGGVHGGVLWDCVLADNVAANNGGAAALSTLNHCRIFGNSAHTGGGTYSCSLSTCAVFGNTADLNGGGAHGGTLNHCTVTGNSCAGTGGGVYGTATNPVRNSIVYHNTASGHPNYAISTLRYSCTTPDPGGLGNITNDPMLVSFADISMDSPCYRMAEDGNSSGTDLDGDPWRDPPSMGADEPSSISTGQLSAVIAAPFTSVSVGFRMPLTARIQGRAAGTIWDFGDGTGASNRMFTSHAWTGTGTFAVALTTWNADWPNGITSTVQISVVESPVFYVAAASSTPEFPFGSWSTAASRIQDAISAATVAGSVVLVSNGIYAVGGATANGLLTNRVALTNAVSVLAIHGPQVTRIVGNGPPGDGATRCAYVGNASVLAGFTLANGATRVNGSDYNDMYGGGVWCAPDALVSNCVITGNASTYYGGGAFGGTLEQCTLAGNTASAGGGSYGGLRIRCTLSANSATQGGGMLGGVARSCVLIGNSASEDGGGAFSATLSNCTLARNAAAQDGGGMIYGTAENCIIYNSLAGGNWYRSTLSYCCTDPLPNGEGNVTNAPNFVSDLSDYRLVPGSPCIDRGNNSLVQTEIDLDGNARLFNGIVDMGAYEFPDIGDPFRRWLRDFGLPIDGSVDNIDSDADGLDNAMEYRAGTNPTNPASVPRLIRSDLEITPRNTLVTLKWVSVTNRLYDLSRATNLLDGEPAFQVLPGASNLSAGPAEGVYTDLIRGNGPYYYRIAVHE